jgi:hypothetical protein
VTRGLADTTGSMKCSEGFLESDRIEIPMRSHKRRSNWRKRLVFKGLSVLS